MCFNNFTMKLEVYSDKNQRDFDDLISKMEDSLLFAIFVPKEISKEIIYERRSKLITFNITFTTKFGSKRANTKFVKHEMHPFFQKYFEEDLPIW